jgi:hypothetical protein
MNLVKNRTRRILGVSLKLLALNCCNLFKPDYNVSYVDFEVLRVIVMKGPMFWDMTPCRPLNVNRRSEGTCHLNLQCLRISQARK